MKLVWGLADTKCIRFMFALNPNFLETEFRGFDLLLPNNRQLVVFLSNKIGPLFSRPPYNTAKSYWLLCLYHDRKLLLASLQVEKQI